MICNCSVVPKTVRDIYCCLTPVQHSLNPLPGKWNLKTMLQFWKAIGIVFHEAFSFFKNLYKASYFLYCYKLSVISTNYSFFIVSNVRNRMQKMPFSRWVASGLVEDKSELTGQPESLQLQRVHMSVGALEKRSNMELWREITLDFKCQSCSRRLIAEIDEKQIKTTLQNVLSFFCDFK